MEKYCSARRVCGSWYIPQRYQPKNVSGACWYSVYLLFVSVVLALLIMNGGM